MLIDRRNTRVSGRTREIIMGLGGQGLRVVEYKIPTPGYSKEGCGPSAFGSMDPDVIQRGAYAAALENEFWRAVLDSLAGGLGSRILESDGVGLEMEMSPCGRELRGFFWWVHERGLIRAIARATDIATEADAALFLTAWADRQDELQALSEALCEEITSEQRPALSATARSMGLRLVPPKTPSGFVARNTLRTLMRPPGG